ncbi:MAG: DUF6794 domain-containing protein [Chloroflexota bacterium]
MTYPRTVREAVRALLGWMTKDERNVMRGLSREELASLHHTLGMSIRNDFGLWGDNYELLISSGMVHPDDASTVILQAVWEAVRRRSDSEAIEG